jgi:superfamily II DNA or RNA helicase
MHHNLLRRGYGGTSVVMQAPIGSGKTYIFELLYPNLKTRAVFTVPTRASGNTAQSHRPQTSAARTAATTENLRIYAS